MKNLSLTFCFIAMMLLGCNSFPQQALLPGALGRSIQEVAIAQQFAVHLDELHAQSPKQVWKQFFHERGAQKFWKQLQGPIAKGPIVSLRFDFEYLETEEPGIADEVAAGIIQYLSYYRQDQVSSMALWGNYRNSNQQLTHLPAATSQLTSLRRLDLNDNQLQGLPAEIGRLKSLQQLHLNDNYLQELPAELGQLNSLQELYLLGNQLQGLPAAIGQLQRLQHLDLSDNQLQELPTWIGQLTSLQQLYLHNNPLRSLNEKLHARIKNKRLKVDLGSNPLLQAAQLTPLAGDSLASYAYQGFPRSLHILCAHYINQHPATFPEEAIANLLPQELSREGREAIIKQDCHWPQQVQIVFFDDEGTPFYLDRQLYTPQDVKDLLEALKDKQLYLVPKD